MPTRPPATLIDGFAYAPLTMSSWHRPGHESALRRDVGVAGASGGVFSGSHWCAGPAGDKIPFGDDETTFHLAFVLAGTAALIDSDGSKVPLALLDAATRWGAGPASVLDMAAAAELLIFSGKPPGAPTRGTNRWRIDREAAEAYRLGDGPRAYFRYRDLGIAAASGRRLHAHIVAAIGTRPGGTGWHHHSMGQYFHVLRGWADLAVENRPIVRMAPHDAMCIGPGMRHDVPAFSDDYMVLEVCIPADYETVAETPHR